MPDIGKYLIAFFFLLMLVIPTTLQAARGVLLAVILFGAILRLQTSPESWKLDKTVGAWLLICVGYSLLAMFNGVYRGAPGAIAVGSVYVVWPILYIFIAGFSANLNTYILLQKTLVLGILLAALSGIMLVASNFFPPIHILDPFFELLGGGLGVYDGIIEYRLTSMTTVIYGFGFLVCFLIMQSNLENNILFPRRFLYLLMILLLVTLLISGRRVFLLLAGLSVPISVLYLHITEMKKFDPLVIMKITVFSLLAFCAILLALYSFLDINYQVVWDDFAAGFDFSNSSNISAARRAEQFAAMTTEWRDTPLLGAGHGAAAADNLGGDELPWAYELQYVALLFQTGIIGVTIYSSAVIWLAFQMIRLSRRDRDLAQLMVPMLVGLTSFLVANATNPYLCKFDYLWTIFFPVALVNMGLLREKSGMCTCT